MKITLKPETLACLEQAITSLKKFSELTYIDSHTSPKGGESTHGSKTTAPFLPLSQKADHIVELLESFKSPEYEKVVADLVIDHVVYILKIYTKSLSVESESFYRKYDRFKYIKGTDVIYTKMLVEKKKKIADFVELVNSWRSANEYFDKEFKIGN